MPSWNQTNLTNHHQKRTTKDAGCFEELMKLAKPMTVAEYEKRSTDAVVHAWGEYEGEGRDVRRNSYYPQAAYFVDDDLVVAIADLARNEFQTCYHEHFGRPHGIEPPPGTTLGQRRLRYIQKLNCDETGGMIRNLKRVKGV